MNNNATLPPCIINYILMVLKEGIEEGGSMHGDTVPSCTRNTHLLMHVLPIAEPIEMDVESYLFYRHILPVGWRDMLKKKVRLSE